MTKEEILALEPGEQLDKAIIEAIMRHVWDHGERPRCEICGMWKDWNKDAGCENRPYSTDISAAWQVKERIFVDLGRRLHLHQDLDNVWWAKFGLAAFRSGKDAPEAICKAALSVKHSTENTR